jgi:hypothetical protein
LKNAVEFAVLILREHVMDEHVLGMDYRESALQQSKLVLNIGPFFCLG